MIAAHIDDGDVVLMEPVNEPSRLKAGTIVAAMVEGRDTTLKHFHSARGPMVRLRKPQPRPIARAADRGRTWLAVQGKLSGGLAPASRGPPSL